MAVIMGKILENDKEQNYIVNAMKLELNDDYFIFVKPFLNGEEPDYIVVKRNGGIFIVDISDIDIREIEKIENNKYNQSIKLKNNEYQIKSPISRITEIKMNLYNYHMVTLFNERLNNPKSIGIVGCGVIFIKNCDSIVHVTFRNIENYVYTSGVDKIKQMCQYIQSRFEHYGKYFTDKMFYEIMEKLQGQKKEVTDFKNYVLSRKQSELVISREGKYKIKGVAGAGKTMILAQRVVNNILRIEKDKNYEPKILVLTFNITLRNYIKKYIMIANNSNVFPKIEINHYHKFIVNAANRYNIPEIEFENENLFMNVKKIDKYDGIFIDEIQDYKMEWQNILVKSFLKSDGEYVVFGDEKQNIYERELERGSRLARTNIPGAWNKLTKSYRSEGIISEMMYKFQKKYFKNKYLIDDFPAVSQDFFGLDQSVKYIKLNDDDFDEVCENIYKILKNEGPDIDNTAVLSNNIQVLRYIEEKIEEKLIPHVITFETQKEYDMIMKRFHVEKNSIDYQRRFNKEIEDIRRIRKYNFECDKGLKMSTIHSFKGWQEENIILIIDSRRNSAEMIYTAITRTKKRLFIIDCSCDKKYSEFFENIR